MKKKNFIFKFLTFLLLLSLLLPSAVSAGNKGPGHGGGGKPPTGETGSLTIHKFAQEQGAEKREGTGNAGESAVGESLPGVKYTIQQTHAYNSNTNEWSAVNRGKSYTDVTDASGKIKFNKLPLGRYSVQEISGPSNVQIDRTKYYVDIPMTSSDGTGPNYDVHIYPKNELINGAVELTKYNGEKKDRKGNYETMSGITFHLFKEDGSRYDDKTYKTDRNGKIQIDGLEHGNYYFQEVGVPGNFLLNGDTHHFSITKYGEFGKGHKGKDKGTIEKVTVKNYYKPTTSKSINKGLKELAVNRGEEFRFNLKVTLPGDIHNYNSFTVTDVLHDDLQFLSNWTVTGAHHSAFSLTEVGQTLTWTVVDFSKLKGKKEVTIGFSAEVKEDAPANVPIFNKGTIDYTSGSGTTGNDKTNKVKVIPTAGSITVIKIDKISKKKEKLLPGASFDLRKDGATVGSGTTDSKGEIKFEDLNYGEYELVETKAPAGYRLRTKPIKVTVNAKNSDVIIKVDNSKNGWELPKTGGIGTTIFSVLGLTFMGVALLMVIRRRRLNA